MEQFLGKDSIIELSEGSGNQCVQLLCLKLGVDLQVILYGGRAHVGAVAAGVCYDKDRKKANASVIALHGHKEDQLAAGAASRLSKRLGRTVALTAGIHYDNLGPAEIKTIIQNADILIDRLIGMLKS